MQESPMELRMVTQLPLWNYVYYRNVIYNYAKYYWLKRIVDASQMINRNHIEYNLNWQKKCKKKTIKKWKKNVIRGRERSSSKSAI